MNSPALTLHEVTKTFGARKALDNVSFELPQSAFLSIFGPNGAGKTTLLRMIATLARPTSGTIQIAGIDVREHPEEARSSIGLISHEPMLYPNLTPEENLIFYGRLYGLTRTEAETRALELLEAVNLQARRKDPVKTFSRGMMQRASIARALVNDPSLILLDEPYAGLDPRGVDITDELLDSLRAGRTFVMVSHDLQKGLDRCSHALLLARGKVVAFGTKDELTCGNNDFASLYYQTVARGVA